MLIRGAWSARSARGAWATRRAMFAFSADPGGAIPETRQMQPFIVNEGSSAFLTVALLDTDGDPAAPAAASYVVVNLETGEVVGASVDIETPTDTLQIVLTPADTALLDADRALPFERRRVVVTADFGDDDVLRDQYDFTIRRITDPTP